MLACMWLVECSTTALNYSSSWRACWRVHVGVHVARGMLDCNRLPLEWASMLACTWLVECLTTALNYSSSWRACWRARGSWNA